MAAGAVLVIERERTPELLIAASMRKRILGNSLRLKDESMNNR